jgi:hypothetical protein
LSEMNKCRHCGIFVPVEKAFCPNCSEPIEPEEAPNRAASFTSDMMATLRDDPENYREMVAAMKKSSAKAAENASENNSTFDYAPDHVQAPPPVVGYNASEAAHGATSPPAKNRRNLVLGIGVVSVLILLFIILLTLRVF